jgi:uncharacterized membrane protein YhiD involved in acid resistance
MSDNELAIAVVAIVFGSIFGMIVIVKLIGLIKAWINRNKSSYDEEKFERLAKAFIQQKKRTEKRLRKLESRTDNQEAASIDSRTSKQKTHLQSELQINPKEEQTRPPTSGGSLRNMLREEERSG